ncbi:YitT family protein [Aquibacillus koreensis]|uniref:YitT family protein n=1 Tax=Aquibacillus koreensis TaxID=279446 RepID=A0A9X3WHT9_9BACI|nr:YitT family protein [Aquibacillus koreensis]MCT2535751.1 YitT family protein [Aquibacillus koreensis]MDC3420207.1 YitT family protein [Aquibacillus koreensis]
MYFLKKGLAIVIGSILLAIGVNYFFVPYHVLDGGMIGIGLIAKYIWGMKIGLTIILLSIPIFVIAWFKYRTYFYNSLHGLLVSSFFIDLFRTIRSAPIQLDAPFSSIIGGIFVGLGIGIMLRVKTSTGGTDLIAQFISDLSGINVGIIIFLIDSIVILVGGLLISMNTLLLSIVAILVVGITTSIYTWKPAKHDVDQIH